MRGVVARINEISQQSLKHKAQNHHRPIIDAALSYATITQISASLRTPYQARDAQNKTAVPHNSKTRLHRLHS